MAKKKQLTINDLAYSVKGLSDAVKELAQDMKTGFRMVRSEMAKNEDLQEVKTSVNSIYKMLDDESRFIQQMQSEYPIILERIKRIEKQLGLPHQISK